MHIWPSFSAFKSTALPVVIKLITYFSPREAAPFDACAVFKPHVLDWLGSLTAIVGEWVNNVSAVKRMGTRQLISLPTSLAYMYRLWMLTR